LEFRDEPVAAEVSETKYADVSDTLSFDEELFDDIDSTTDILLHSYYAFLTQQIKLPVLDSHYDLFDITDEEHFMSMNNVIQKQKPFCIR